MISAPEGTRTPNLLIRSQMLYPIGLRVQCILTDDEECKNQDKKDNNGYVVKNS